MTRTMADVMRGSKKKIKRQRTSSGPQGLSSSDITANLQRYGESKLHCTVHISKGIHESGNDVVLRYTCAIINSGGGILHMCNEDYNSGVCSKDLDTWWSGMENKFANMISCDDICNYFDMVGNYDDPDLYLFIKSAEHICTIDYHSRLPTDTATHEVTYHSVMKLLQKSGPCSDVSSLPPIPNNFVYGFTHESLKQETKQIQFKHLCNRKTSRDGKNTPDKIKYMVSKYISAFANHEGGHIYFGIDDLQAAVYGEEMTREEQDRTVRLIQIRMDIIIWGSASFKAERGRHWDIKFCPVYDPSQRKSNRVVVVVSVCKFPGGVFTTTPDSYYVAENGKVECWSFDQWRKAMLTPYRDKPELHGRFIKIPLTVPQAPLIFTLKHTISRIKDKLFTEKAMKLPQPHHYLSTIQSPKIRDLVHNITELFSAGRHLSIFVNCWGLPVSFPPHPDITCNLFVLSETQGCHLFTISDSRSDDVWQLSQKIAANLKYKMVSLGGCIVKFGIICHIVNNNNFHKLRNRLSGFFYPSHFAMTSLKFDDIVQSLVITMAAYEPVDFTTLNMTKVENILSEETYFFMLTCDQFELLWTQQFTKELWVHSPPGAGKTVAAVQFIQELKRRGCAKEEILYLAENEVICSYVRSYNICLVSTRREFMKNVESSKFQKVCNVIVDEAQNFKDRDGDWYTAAERLTQRTSPANNENLTRQAALKTRQGYFWVFMDYLQKVHKFKAGLPSIIGKNNFMMSEITRNAKEIFQYAMHFMRPVQEGGENLSSEEVSQMKRVESIPELGHDYKSGENVQVLKCQKQQLKEKLFEVLSNIIDSGVNVDDLAVLVGRKSDKDKIKAEVQNIGHDPKRDITVDSVKEFSGMDRRTIVGVDPRVNGEHADFNRYMLSLATRARDQLVIISTSDDLQQNSTTV